MTPSPAPRGQPIEVSARPPRVGEKAPAGALLHVDCPIRPRTGARNDDPPSRCSPLLLDFMSLVIPDARP